MKRVVNPRSVTQTVCFVVVLCAFSATVLAKTSDMQKVATDNNQFACDLYAKLVKKQGGNLFFAPHSISTALAMTYAGAEGQTAAQMARVLHFRLPQTRLHRAFGQLVSTITARSKQGKVRLSIANALWGQKRYGFAEAFLETVRTHYAAAVERLDFKKDPSRARMDINRWVEKKTNQKIKDLIPQGVIKKDTRLVLTNAVYFLASWARAFEKYRTQKGDFHLPDGRKRKVAMMNAKRSFPYMVGRGFRALELPYRGHRLGMVVLLPNQRKGLVALERKLDAKLLSRVFGRLYWKKVKLYLPKFKLRSSFRLAKTLKAMGMPRAFSDRAQFSTMTKNPKDRLKINEVIHKSFISVSENGTEAAAATAVVMGTAGGMPLKPPPTPVFRADHPFIYLIRDRKTGAILFWGRLLDPNG